MQNIRDGFELNFMGRRRIALAFSIVLMLISLGSLFTKGLNYGIDFTGGTLVEVGYSQAADLNQIRQILVDDGYNDVVVQYFGTAKDVLIRIAPREDVNQTELGDKVFDTLRRSSQGQAPELRRTEVVGPQVGEELREEGGLAMLIALGAILLYVSMRFIYKFALGAVAALVHDVIATVGLFSLLGLEFDLTVLAAVLAVIGYSLNDTIVVFDRMRENFRKVRKGTAAEVMNTSLNHTLSRTLLTSLTTVLVLVALFVFGGELIHGFATALLFGVVVGTYSSIYVASTTALALGVSKSDMMPAVKESVNSDGSQV